MDLKLTFSNIFLGPKLFKESIYDYMDVYVAQWITHQTSNLGIVGSSPIIDSHASFG